ncbi:hypothetical protein WJX81_005875 [Elliptochloris bilobata]|uniref:Ketosynthase family 3 (KS3) domain-containing protein n=1 Tax=Elliptochloris bilobata TaxID=381761 RepID=A0AAW1S822_9CHLO
MDPQQRLLLETAAGALADAGGGPGGSAVGVYVGCMYQEYVDVQVAAQGRVLPQAVVGSGLSFMALSSVGRCRTFDAAADGYGRGEGVAVMLLRPLGLVSEGGSMPVMMAGSAVNQDGRSSALTAPNGPAQSALVRAALASAAASADNVACVSVHGTGTPLGDPIEVGALRQALDPAAGAPPLALVSSKACCGHTEGAAGLTGLLLTAAALREGARPPVAHLRALNPYVATALSGATSGGTFAHLPRQAGAHKI